MKYFNHYFRFFFINIAMFGIIIAQDTTITVTSDGNVGIGLTNPTHKLVVDGNLRVVGDNRLMLGGPFSAEYIYNPTGTTMRFHVGNADRLFIGNAGNVGIGTNGPFSRLHVHTDDVTRTDFSTASTSSPVFLRFFYNSNIQGGAVGFDTDENVLKLVHGGNFGSSSKGLAISSNGTVGIGTTNPAGDLEVMDDEGSTTNVYFTAINDLVLGGTLGLRKARGTVSAPEDVQNGDRMGIIAGHGKSGFSYWSTGTIQFDVDGTFTSGERPPSRITFHTNGANSGATERVRIDKDGNVGIGTALPQGALDVNGSIYHRGVSLHADYVFENDYQLEAIEEHADFMWKQKHLKAIPKASFDKDGQEIVEVGSHRRGIVEELEKAHIYIDQLNNRIKTLEAKLDILFSKQENN